MHRTALPMLDNPHFLTDGGLETTLVFMDGLELPCFAAFPLVETEVGAERLRAYYRRYLAIAERRAAGFVLETPTWRASAGWGRALGYTPADIVRVNRRAVALLDELRRNLASTAGPRVISGCIGPQGDGYAPDALLSIEEAQRYHTHQVETFADTPAELVTAMTLTYAEEAIGIARAARKAEIPCVLSFTVETDGRLPSGESLSQAIERVDAATGDYAAYYMINCVHPSHFRDVLDKQGAWRFRIRGLRANASRMSHEELDNATVLDDGSPMELGDDYATLLTVLPHLNVFGGCCGTDHRHVEAIADACLSDTPRAPDAPSWYA